MHTLRELKTEKLTSEPRVNVFGTVCVYVYTLSYPAFYGALARRVKRMFSCDLWHFELNDLLFLHAVFSFSVLPENICTLDCILNLLIKTKTNAKADHLHLKKLKYV